MPSLFFLVNTLEPQSMNAKLVLPIIPIGIVAYALTLLWDNLCRNSCILWSIDHFTVVCSVTWPLNDSEAGVDLVLIQISLLLSCKYT